MVSAFVSQPTERRFAEFFSIKVDESTFPAVSRLWGQLFLRHCFCRVARLRDATFQLSESLLDVD